MAGAELRCFGRSDYPLSIHDTKRETIRVMAKRMAAFLVALLLAPVCFYWLGYRPIAVGAFLLVLPRCAHC